MYLDTAASAKAIATRAAERMRELVGEGLGNPSSAHREGQRARRVLRQAREEVAAVVGADPEEVVFTSGVSEALFLAVSGLKALRTTVTMSAYEHDSMRQAVDGLAVSTFTLDPRGRPDRTLTGLVCCALVNHEIGLLLDVEAITDGAWILDGAQAHGRLAMAWQRTHVAALALSSHKIGGPTGVGALLVRKGAPFVPRVRGGHQEQELRAGTEAVIAIAGFARALSEPWPDLATVTATFEAEILSLQGAAIVGHGHVRAPGISAVRITGVAARALVETLDARGIAISAGAACASQRQEPSNVTAALGLSRERGLEVFRVSFGRDADAASARLAAREIIDAARALRGEVHAA